MALEIVTIIGYNTSTSMDIHAAAQELSKRGVQVRTQKRELVCKRCHRPFEARSSKAQYCSRSCLRSVLYIRERDGLFSYIETLQRKVNGMLDLYPSIDVKLRKISEILASIKPDLRPPKLPLTGDFQ